MIPAHLTSAPPGWHWRASPDGSKRALFADDRNLRGLLERWWKPHLAPMGVLALNPSTATHLEDDPTIRRCVGFARREQAGGLVMANLSPFRATDPKVLYHLLRQPEGRALAMPDDHRPIVLDAFDRCAFVVVAFGGLAGAGPHVSDLLRAEARAIVAALTYRGVVSVYCLGQTADGDPRHPLYLRAEAPLSPWSPR